jgi:hypothetical protein
MCTHIILSNCLYCWSMYVNSKHCVNCLTNSQVGKQSKGPIRIWWQTMTCTNWQVGIQQVKGHYSSKVYSRQVVPHVIWHCSRISWISCISSSSHSPAQNCCPAEHTCLIAALLFGPEKGKQAFQGCWTIFPCLFFQTNVENGKWRLLMIEQCPCIHTAWQNICPHSPTQKHILHTAQYYSISASILCELTPTNVRHLRTSWQLMMHYDFCWV